MAKMSITRSSVLFGFFAILTSMLSGVSSTASAQSNTVIDLGKMSRTDFSNFAVDAVLAYGDLNIGRLTDAELNAVFNPGSRSSVNQFERQRYLSSLEERKNARSRFFDRDSYPLLRFSIQGELVDYDFRTGYYAICYQGKIGIGANIAISLTYPPHMIEPGQLLIGACSSSEFNRLLVPMSPDSAEKLFNQTKEETIQGSMRSTIRRFSLGVSCLLHESVGGGRDKNRSFPDCSVQDLDYQFQDAGLRQDLRAPVIWGPYAPKILGYAETEKGIRWLSSQEQQEYLQRVAQDKVRQEEAERAALRAEERAKELAEENRIANLPEVKTVPCTNEGLTRWVSNYEHCEKYVFSHNEKDHVRAQKSKEIRCIYTLADNNDFDIAYEGRSVRISPKGGRRLKEAAVFEMRVGAVYNDFVCGYREIPASNEKTYSLSDLKRVIGSGTWTGDIAYGRSEYFMMSVYFEGNKMVFEQPGSGCRGTWISEEGFDTPGAIQNRADGQSCGRVRGGHIRLNMISDEFIQYEWRSQKDKKPEAWGILRPYEIYSKR